MVLITLPSVGRVRRLARKLRVEFPGAIYQVMNRGDRREEIFRDDRDRARFLETMAEARRGQEQGEAFAGIRRGWCLGDETFRQELLERVSAKPYPGN